MDSVEVEYDHRAGAVVIRVTGEIDIQSSPGLTSRLGSIHEVGGTPSQVVVDLTGVTFLDSSGMSALVVFALACAKRGVTFRMIPTPFIRRSFLITGLGEVMGMTESEGDVMLTRTDESEADG